MNRINESFTTPLLNWHFKHGRHNLPWQTPRSAYYVWLSEIMLQQTQVKTVIPYFLRFIERFPTLPSLAQAQEDDILALWSGLGYYSRARHLHQTAKRVMQDYGGDFPADLTLLKQLPGIGPSTAAAIASLVFNQPTPILDGNVKRVLSRYFRLHPTHETAWRAYEKQLFTLAQTCMSQTACADYTQAIMDLGALCCTPKQPLCHTCPVAETCQAYLSNVVDVYPYKKKSRPLPTKHTHFLLFYRRNPALAESTSIYLEKNPPKGIWGGLWSLPALEMETSLADHLQAHYHTKMTEHPITAFKHTFTHYHLNIQATAVAWSVTQAHPCLATSNQSLENLSSTYGLSDPRFRREGHPEGSDLEGRWYHESEWSALGLPQPIRKIIQIFFATLAQPSSHPPDLPPQPA